jgi:hypothetical protein
MFSRKRLSNIVFVCWLASMLGRSAVYSSSRDYADGVYLLADLVATVAGVLLGFDAFTSAKTCVIYRINRLRRKNRSDSEIWVGLIQGVGVFFLIVNLFFIGVTLWKIVNGVPSI